MKLLVNVKKMGSRRNSIVQEVYEIPETPETVRELITMMVGVCVKEYNLRAEKQEVLRCLSKEEIEEQAVTGKIGFGINYRGKRAEEKKAVENALQCFEDGIYRIFVGEQALQELEERLVLQDGAEVAFVRLTMLSGRLW